MKPETVRMARYCAQSMMADRLRATVFGKVKKSTSQQVEMEKHKAQSTKVRAIGFRLSADSQEPTADSRSLTALPSSSKKHRPVQAPADE